MQGLFAAFPNLELRSSHLFKEFRTNLKSLCEFKGRGNYKLLIWTQTDGLESSVPHQASLV